VADPRQLLPKNPGGDHGLNEHVDSDRDPPRGSRRVGALH